MLDKRRQRETRVICFLTEHDSFQDAAAAHAVTACTETSSPAGESDTSGGHFEFRSTSQGDFVTGKYSVEMQHNTSCQVNVKITSKT